MWNPFEKQLNKLQKLEGTHRISDTMRQPQPTFQESPPEPESIPQPDLQHESYATPSPMTESDPSQEQMGNQFQTQYSNSIAEVAMMGEVAVATFTVTDLTHSNGVQQLASLLQDLSETGARHYVLDIQNIQFMDSMCLGCLVETLNGMAESGGKIALANSDLNVQQLFRMTRLDRVFPICRDVMSALTAVERERA